MNVSDFADMDPEEITYSLVASKLDKLNQNKTCGADKLHPKLLKNCAEAFAVPLTLIFRSSLASSEIPIQFRLAKDPTIQKR